MAGFPAWRYGPNGQAQIFDNAGQVPEGWADRPPSVDMWIDPFQATDEVTAPARRTAAIVPSDNGLLPRTTKALYIGVGGDVVLRAADDDSDTTFVNVPDGMTLQVRAAAVRATGTTATSIVGFF